jgi:molybdate transport system regulatory protein
MKKKEIRLRCWIDIEGAKFFGPGPAELLGHIGTFGSIAKAAKKMGMSYKKAWDLVDELNTRGRKPYVISHKGGERGGGAELTETGKRVLSMYRALTDKLHAVIREEKDFLKAI